MIYLYNETIIEVFGQEKNKINTPRGVNGDVPCLQTSSIAKIPFVRGSNSVKGPQELGDATMPI